MLHEENSASCASIIAFKYSNESETVIVKNLLTETKLGISVYISGHIYIV